MKATLPFLLLLLLAGHGLLAQESPQDESIFNHYIQHPILVNPAAAGFADDYTLQVNARTSWAGFADNPKTVALRANGPVGQSFGIGAALFSESAAQQRRLKGQVDVAFRFGFGKETKGVPAVQAAFGFYSLVQRLTVDPEVMSNPRLQPGDRTLMEYFNGRNVFDAGIGIYATYLNQTFGGLTINNLVVNRLSDISGSNVSEGFNYTLMFGQHFLLEDSGVKLTPSLMLRNIQDAPFRLDINIQAGFLQDQFIAGLSYRNTGALGLLLGTQLRGLEVYYSFDLHFGEFQQYSNGGHELTVAYSINRRAVAESRRRRAAEQNRR